MKRTVLARTMLLVAACTIAASACATEVIESGTSTTNAEAAVGIGESLSGADLTELVIVLKEETAALSTSVFDGDKVAARSHVVRINEAWALAEPLIIASYGELADQITYDLRRVIELARSSVERNRPADADKAVAFLNLALASLDLQS